ncbi:sodium-dependent transporter [Entomospira nematocerorum]|uniref:Sodium-dependent transporter n=1 Tax=Entomospira nematocerorum TaxID=2719987 RepID=A0A968GEL3_9SPIO|nr:sodium-dependent transporter [Entomospira nematocera]NIZ46346.1 sodium-dependent transporter [Entomospira nematocera]WDI33850.1 sodium-dependent transporter [Entomospira nematocera]
MSAKQEQWGSNFGFVMAMIASAVGLGSIWRFPYIVGTNGGSAFIILYIFLIIVVGIIGMSVEVALGRNSGVDAIDAYTKHAPKSKALGYMGILTGFILMSIYSVLGAWVLHYVMQSLLFNLTSLPSDHFYQFITSYEPSLWQLLFILMSAAIVSAGVSKGIEKYSSLINIILLVLIIIVTIRSVTLPGAMEGIKYLLKPDFAKLIDSNVWLMAIGHAFFSLSLGAGAAITFGCYVKKETNIIKSSAITGFTTLGMALLMGFAIFPAVFAAGAKPDSGPGLLFEVLPHVFANIKGGSIFAILFFIATFLAALTSTFSMIESLIIRIMTVTKAKRTTVTWSLTAILIVISLPMSLSYNLLSGVILFDRNLMGNVEFLIDKILMPLNSIILLIIAGWFWKSKGILQELSNNGSIRLPMQNLMLWAIRVILPLFILIILLKPLVEYLVAK